MGTLSGRVGIALGCADCAWTDLERALELVEDPIMLAINDSIALYPGHVHHAVTLHPEKLVGEFHPSHNPDSISWQDMRAENGYNTDYVTWSRRNPEWVDHQLDNWGAGSSGLYAVTVAFFLGIEKVILCGVPITPTPHYAGATGFEGPTGEWDEYNIHRPGWESQKRRLRGRVKSMSGWTQQLLGEPTREWVKMEVVQ